MSWLKENWKWTLVNSIAMLLFTSFLWQAASNGFSAEAVRFLVGSTGNLAMIYLLLSLAMTPLHILRGAIAQP